MNNCPEYPNNDQVDKDNDGIEMSATHAMTEG